MKKAELAMIIESHEKWINKITGGERADLSGADLSGADLSGADLSGADLSAANLTGANLNGTYLRGANLSGTYLLGANLTGAELREANLSGANLCGANLTGVNLRDADLRGADLRGADLRGAELDFSCLPLWCGSLSAQFDDRQIIQFVYHVVKAGLVSKNVSEEVKDELTKLIGLANQFHRVSECGKITADHDKS